VGAELFHADGQADMKKLIGIFCNFANAPKNFISFYIEQLYRSSPKGNHQARIGKCRWRIFKIPSLMNEIPCLKSTFIAIVNYIVYNQGGSNAVIQL
jgi:hypothetical protein